MVYPHDFPLERPKHQTRVLVVAANTDTGPLLDDAFADEAFQVTSVPDSLTALTVLVDKAASEQPFDLIVSFFQGDDPQHIAFLKVAKQQLFMPAMILIGTPSLDAVLGVLRLGAADYLFEPVNLAELRASATAALARRQELLHRLQLMEGIIDGFVRLHAYHEKYTDHSINDQHCVTSLIKVGKLTIDTERHAIEWCGQPCPVTPIEYALLRYLAETPNHARSYGEIVRWTHGHSVNDTEAKILLKSHARNLRRKLGPDTLVNLKGVGYVLKVGSGRDLQATSVALMEDNALLP